jgi:RNA recognition motif-containing protein
VISQTLPRKAGLEVKLYVGNLPYNTSEDSLRQLFTRHGEVTRIWIGNTRVGAPHGYGFVQMPDVGNAEKAIAKLNGLCFQGNEISVHRARD